MTWEKSLKNDNTPFAWPSNQGIHGVEYFPDHSLQSWLSPTKSPKSPAKINSSNACDQTVCKYGHWANCEIKFHATALNPFESHWELMYDTNSESERGMKFDLAGDFSDFVWDSSSFALTPRNTNVIGKVFNCMYALVWWPCEGCFVVFEGLCSGHSGGWHGAVSSLYIFPTHLCVIIYTGWLVLLI